MKKEKKQQNKIINIIKITCILVFVVWMLFTNLGVAFTHYEVSYECLPNSFDGFRIAQISDFHNAGGEMLAEHISERLKKENPDIIVITGDLIDSTKTDVEVALKLVEKLVDIAPCYYVTGNHEAWVQTGEYQKLENGLIACGVTVLRDKEVLISQGDEKISLIGVDDPDYAIKTGGIGKMMETQKINELSSDNLFTIMLSHRPEYFQKYRETDVNLVLSGHAHGGQFRLPFIGGLVAPNQGLFPEYDSGVYEGDDFAMVVSRGVGNSVIPVRFNNMPEVVIVELSDF